MHRRQTGESLREEGVIDHVQFKSEQSPDD